MPPKRGKNRGSNNSQGQHDPSRPFPAPYAQQVPSGVVFLDEDDFPALGPPVSQPVHKPAAGQSLPSVQSHPATAVSAQAGFRGDDDDFPALGASMSQMSFQVVPQRPESAPAPVGQGRGIGPASQPPRPAAPVTAEPQVRPQQAPAAVQSPQRVVPAQPPPNAAAPVLLPLAASEDPGKKGILDLVRSARDGGLTLLRRPGYGTVGSAIRLITNHFKFDKFPTGGLFHYDVDVTGPVDKKTTTTRPIPKSINRKIVHQMKKERFASVVLAYDGAKNLYSMTRLPGVPDEGKVRPLPSPTTPLQVLFDVAFQDEDMHQPRTYQVRVQLAETPFINTKPLLDYIKQPAADGPQDVQQAFEIVLRHLPSLPDKGNIIAGRTIYFADGQHQDLGFGRELWWGVHTSIRATEGGITLNLNVTATDVFKEMSVIDFMYEILQPRGDLHSLQERDRKKLEAELKGLKVEMKIDAVIRRQKVAGVGNQPANRHRFDVDGRQTTVSEYFLKKYKYKLKYPDLPCLRLGGKDSYYPMELCRILPNQKKMKKVSELVTAALIKSTAVPPSQRLHNIQGMLKTCEFDKLGSFGMQLNMRPLDCDGRMLPPPTLQLGKEMTPRDGVWNMANEQLARGATLTKWGAVSFDERTDEDTIWRFMAALAKTGCKQGIKMAACGFVEFGEGGQEEATLKRIKRAYPGLELLLVVLNGRENGRYARYPDIKRTCETEVNIMSQCVHAKNVVKMNGQVVSNICLKINQKMGGQNFGISRGGSIYPSCRQSPKFVDGYKSVFSQPIMFVGADVNHPAAGDTSQPSVAAVVASMDAQPAQHVARVRAQKHRMELIEGLDRMMYELVEEFRSRIGGRYPARIVFYRDGVGEGQFYQVLAYELNQIQNVFRQFPPEQRPKITFITVQKRHHTRFFPRDQKDASKSGNIPPGTCVDRNVVHPHEFDFFLCSHLGIQGTSKPSHYKVLYDESHFSVDVIQNLTNSLCYVYARCPRAVSIPAPVYYAHHAAFRTKDYLSTFDETSTVTSGSGSEASLDDDQLRILNEKIQVVPEILRKAYFT